MTTADSVDAYIQWMNPFSDFAFLGAPAISNANGSLFWLQAFLYYCNGRCKIDFVLIHWYGDYTDINGFKEYLNAANQIAGSLDLWVTEVLSFPAAVLPLVT